MNDPLRTPEQRKTREQRQQLLDQARARVFIEDAGDQAVDHEGHSLLNYLGLDDPQTAQHAQRLRQIKQAS